MNKQAHDLTKQGRNMVTQLGAYRGQWDLVAKTVPLSKMTSLMQFNWLNGI